MIILNFLKAFDNLLRQKLLRKLDNYGIRGEVWRWVSAFLSNRVQQVVLKGEVSSPMPVVIGIPQGSVLEHLLFLFSKMTYPHLIYLKPDSLPTTVLFIDPFMTKANV